MAKLNQRQELFCQNMLKGKSATEAARLAGYSPKTAQEQSSRLLSNVMICQRLAALQEAVATGNIANKIEREEKLTEVIRTKLPDKVSAKERIMATSELNKMEGVYGADGAVIIDNRVLNINVISEKGKDLTKRLVEGERTE